MNINDMSIEELENCVWGDIEFDSYVVRTSHNARKKPLKKLSDEEIRLLINQKIGLKYVLPIAVSILIRSPLISVYYFEGDLLLAVLRLSLPDWKDNQKELQMFKLLIKDNISLIKSCEVIPYSLLKEYTDI